MNYSQHLWTETTIYLLTLSAHPTLKDFYLDSSGSFNPLPVQVRRILEESLADAFMECRSQVSKSEVQNILMGLYPLIYLPPTATPISSSTLQNLNRIKSQCEKLHAEIPSWRDWTVREAFHDKLRQRLTPLRNPVYRSTTTVAPCDEGAGEEPTTRHPERMPITHSQGLLF